MVVKEGRFGRKNGKGFYDYPASGPKSLWPGLSKIVGKRLDPDTVSVKDLKDRFLFTVALEAARCMAEGVVTDPREADVGSILGFGYAPYSGGALSFIDFMGLEGLRRAREGAGGEIRPAVRAQREARPDGRARRDVLRDLRREAEARPGSPSPGAQARQRTRTRRPRKRPGFCRGSEPARRDLRIPSSDGFSTSPNAVL